MSQATPASNVTALRLPNIAPLRNVLLVRQAMESIVKRAANLPGIAAVYGPAGVGKSNGCSAAAALYHAVYVEVRSHFTKKSFLLAILAEMSIKPARTTSEMVDQISEELMLSAKPLILDEGDYLASRNLLELVRDIYEGSKAPILLVGEERFPMAVKRASERFYDRVLKWQPAELADMDDARKLAKLYAPELEIRDDLLSEILRQSRGIARRIAVNIENVRAQAKGAGVRAIDLERWGQKQFFTGEAPVRRAS